MNAKKLNKYLLVLFVFGLGLSGYIVKYASGWLESNSGELAKLKTDVYVLEQKNIHLDSTRKFLSSHTSEINTLNEVLPTSKDQAKIIKQLDSITEKANVTIESVSFPSSSLGSAPPKVAPATPAETTTNTPATGQKPEEAPKPTPKIISQATPLKDIAGVQTISITLGAINSKNLPEGASGLRYEDMIAFIKELERNQRIMQTSSIEIGQRTLNKERYYTLTISLAVFLRS
jgi:cell division septation protein DedD